MDFAAASILFGSDEHYLDHLAPLSALLAIPLVCTDDEIAERARAYYPKTEVICQDVMEVGNFLVEHFEVAFTCMPRVLFDELFFFSQSMHHKKMQSVWCPHGQSDKGHLVPYFEALENEKALLIYGQKMLDIFEKKGLLKGKAYVPCGNYRYQYYKMHRNFYQNLVHDKIRSKLESADWTLLYAPTWNDQESSSSISQALKPLLEKLPPKVNLLIKLHPNLLRENGNHLIALKAKYEYHPHIHFIDEFSPVHPLLDEVDAYIGDLSSVGYDFLPYNRPMFFLNHKQRDCKSDPGLALYDCGFIISPEEFGSIYQKVLGILEHNLDDFEDARGKTYRYAFGEEKPLSTFEHQIQKMLKIILEEDPL